VVLKGNAHIAHEQLGADIVAAVRARVGAIACLRTVAVVSRLPKTRSGKILRGVMRKIAANEKWGMPATIEEPAVLQVRVGSRFV
jgi:propionyl-CoA synthetase